MLYFINEYLKNKIEDEIFFYYEDVKVKVTFSSYIQVEHLYDDYVTVDEFPILEVDFCRAQELEKKESYEELIGWKNPIGFFHQLSKEIYNYLIKNNYKYFSFSGSTDKRDRLYLKLLKKKSNFKNIQFDNKYNYQVEYDNWNKDQTMLKMINANRVWSL